MDRMYACMEVQSKWNDESSEALLASLLASCLLLQSHHQIFPALRVFNTFSDIILPQFNHLFVSQHQLSSEAVHCQIDQVQCSALLTSFPEKIEQQLTIYFEFVLQVVSQFTRITKQLHRVLWNSYEAEKEIKRFRNGILLDSINDFLYDFCECACCNGGQLFDVLADIFLPKVRSFPHYFEQLLIYLVLLAVFALDLHRLHFFLLAQFQHQQP